MQPRSATPLDILEAYFDTKLERSSLKRFDRVPEDEWVDFARHYRDTMEARFAPEFLADPTPPGGDDPLRLYFEPRMQHEWDLAVRDLHAPTPLLGLSPDPSKPDGITREDASRMLAPLKKHLLMADSVYVRDNFYYCFDLVADSADATWRAQGPNMAALVQDSVRKLKQWLPLLIELRGLIESRALVFMPYYVTPSFPYDANAPALKPALQKLRVRASPSSAPHPYLNDTEIIGAWLNSRLLGLDPIFPNRAMLDLASSLYFDDDVGATDFTSDLVSVDILPFGQAGGIGLDELLRIRKDDDVFGHVRHTVIACKDYIGRELGPDTSQKGVTDACKEFLRTSFDEYERRSILRFVDDKPVAGVAVSLAVGAALISAAHGESPPSNQVSARVSRGRGESNARMV